MVSSYFIQNGYSVCMNTFGLLHGIGKSKVKAIEEHYRNSWMEPQVLYIRTQRGFQNVLRLMVTSEPEITIQNCPDKSV